MLNGNVGKAEAAGMIKGLEAMIVAEACRFLCRLLLNWIEGGPEITNLISTLFLLSKLTFTRKQTEHFYLNRTSLI